MSDLRPGVVVGGDFEVQRLLQKGGMGAVYAAVQQSTGKQRALKVMHPEIVPDPAHRLRFQQEARVASHIDSDHVVEVVAAGIDEAGGFPWLAMEFLEGEELGQLVARDGRLPPEQALEVISQLYHGVARAHAAGIVHRDLKPENLFLARSRRVGVPFTLKILDFGIAKLLHDTKTHATTQSLGTPLWMAPEQSDQRSVVSPATDVWALALLTFWLSTGRHYWLAAEDPAATLTGLLREILIAPMSPASARATDASVSLPPGFDAWFARCTERDPKLRIQNAELAFAELQPLLGRPSVHSDLALTGTMALPVTPTGEKHAPVLTGHRPSAEQPALVAASAPAPAIESSLPGLTAPVHAAPTTAPQTSFPPPPPPLVPAPPQRGHEDAHGYFHPLVYPLSDAGSATQIWWLALINYVPFINLLLLRGFRLELTRRVMRGERPYFPPASQMLTFLLQGALLWTMTALYLVPPLLLMAILGLRGITAFFGDLLTLAGIAFGLTDASIWAFVVQELWSSFLAAVVDSVWAILSLPLYRAAMIHYAVTSKLSAFFAIHTNIGFMVRHWKAFANTYLFSFLVNTLIAFVSLFLLSTAIGALAIPLLALPVYYWTTGYEYGHLAQLFARDLADPATARGQLRWLLVPALLALTVHQCTPEPLPQPELEAVAAAAQPGCASLLGRPNEEALTEQDAAAAPDPASVPAADAP